MNAALNPIGSRTRLHTGDHPPLEVLGKGVSGTRVETRPLVARIRFEHEGKSNKIVVTKGVTMNNNNEILSVVANLAASTPRQAVDRLRAVQLASAILQESGELVWRSQVETATAMLWETVGNDLRYTLPGEVADRMPNATAARQSLKAARAAVEVVIASWKKTGVLIQDAKKQKETK